MASGKDNHLDFIKKYVCCVILCAIAVILITVFSLKICLPLCTKSFIYLWQLELE